MTHNQLWPSIQPRVISCQQLSPLDRISTCGLLCPVGFRIVRAAVAAYYLDSKLASLNCARKPIAYHYNVALKYIQQHGQIKERG